jgi:hypothetical protein
MRNLTLLITGTILLACSQVEKNDSVTHTEITDEKTANPTDTSFREGDILFQTSGSGQSLAIQLATNSPYSHCGILLEKNGQLFVFEAIQPVKFTPIDKWIKRGDDHYYVLKRLIKADSILHTENINKMRKLALAFEGKDYDLPFEWSDEKLYCSELVYKMLQRTTGFEVGKLASLKDFDLNAPIVKRIMKERYGNTIPYDQQVISPVAIFNSPLLLTVKEGNKR